MFCEKCGAPLVEGKCPNCDVGENKKDSKSKNRNMAIFAVILSVLSIGLLVGGFFALSSPKTIALQSISNWSGLLKKGVGNTNNLLGENLQSHSQIQLDGSLLLEVDPTLSLGFDKLELKFTHNEDQKSNKSKFNFQILLGEESIGLDGIFANDKMYFKMKDILDQYHYMDMEFVSLFQDTGDVDYEKLIDIVFDNLKESIDGDSFQKSKETLSLGDRTKKTTKISYKVTTKKLAEVLIHILEDIKNGKDFMTVLEKAYGSEEESFSSQIQTAISELKKLEKQKEEVLFYYNVYYYGFNNIVMEEFADDESAIQFYHYDQINELKVTDIASKTNYFTLKVVEGKDSSEISGFILTYPYHGTYQGTDKGDSLKVTIELDDGDALNMELASEIKNDKSALESQIRFILGGQLGGVDLAEAIKFTTTVRYTFDQKVDVSGIEEAKSFEEMSQEEQMAMLEALQNHPFIASILELFGDSDMDLNDSDFESADSDWDMNDFDM